jgi:RNase_H superfamily
VKILYLDLETSPITAHTWGLWQQNISLKQILQSTEVMCFGARWHGQKKVIFKSVHHDGKKAMLKELHAIMDEADAIVGWNSKSFDHKHIRREFLEAGMAPPSPTKDIDLMLECRKYFRFPSYKLDYVAQKLGVGAKVEHSGFELWIKCMAGNEKAWREMKKYQIQDVNLLVDLYEKLLPWLKIPSVAAHDFIDNGCTNCGSTNIHSRGLNATDSGTYRRFQCMDCKAWMRGAKKETSTTMRKI